MTTISEVVSQNNRVSLKKRVFLGETPSGIVVKRFLNKKPKKTLPFRGRESSPLGNARLAGIVFAAFQLLGMRWNKTGRFRTQLFGKIKLEQEDKISFCWNNVFWEDKINYKLG